MPDQLRDLEVLALDCQAAGATPAHGDLLELGWAVCGASGLASGVESRWIVPRTARRIPRPIRELTGWSEACVAEAFEETAAWSLLLEGSARIASPRVPTVIHYACFELPFLRDLHERLGGPEEFPFDAICVHAVAARLFPDLPRRNIRALSGFLGHSPELIRRSAGHVEATAFIWRALVPLLAQAGITSWSALKVWLDGTAPGPRAKRRSYPLAAERRRALPDAPGVYRFSRRSGDVLYVGKATSLKKRVAAHFKSSGPGTERGLELLTQVHDIDYTETESLLEAALLETDEIKRLDPPYNVLLRAADRSAWFASRAFDEAVAAPDARHRVGPLPSERALAPLVALIALIGGEPASPGLRAAALAVPVAFLPEAALFDAGFGAFVADHLTAPAATARRRVLAASRALWLERGRVESTIAEPDQPPDSWDLARVRRRLERSLVQTGLLLRRARFLGLLADMDVAFREPGSLKARALYLERGRIVERRPLERLEQIADRPPRRPSPRHERQLALDASAYDRLRVLLTELHRIREAGGELALRLGARVFAGERVARLLAPL